MSRPECLSLDFQGQHIAGVRYAATEPASNCAMLVHGFSATRTGTGRAFVDLAQLLTKSGCTVYAFDRLGHGESDGRFLDVTVPGELDQLSAMLDYVLAQGDGSLHLLGHSLGGMEAAYLCGQRHGDIDSLTLWAPAAVFMDDIKNNEIQGESLSSARETGVFDFNGQALGIAYVDTVSGFNPYDGIDAFKGNVWLHQGEVDPIVPMECAERYAEIWSENATLYRYPKANHGWNRLADRTLLLQRSAVNICGNL